MNWLFIYLPYFLLGIINEDIVSDLKSKSQTENKHIAVYFSGSDWCTNCHKFKANTLNEEAVDTLLKNNFIYYTADFPQRTKLDAATRKANEFMADKLNPAGEFPVLVIADHNWNVIHKIYKGHELTSVIEKLQLHSKR